MKTLAVFRSLGPVDLKNMGRDAMLLWIPVLPLILALVLRIGVPELSLFLRARWGFDLEPYYPLILSNFLMLVPAIGGMVVGFLLLDERDDRVLSALLVTPMPIGGYLLYRVSVPILLGLAMTLASYPFTGLPLVPLADLLVVALLGSLTGPLLALFLASFAENKVTGFALVKIINAVMLIPIAAFFMTSRWQLLAGVVPTYWPLKILWLAVDGLPYWHYALVGLIVNLAALAMLMGRFTRVIYQ